MKVMFVNDSTSNPNWGDRAAAIGLQAMIRAVGGQITYTLTEQEIADSALAPAPPGLSRSAGRPGALQAWTRKVVPPVAFGIAGRVRLRRTSIPRTWREFPDFASAVLGPDSEWPGLGRALQGTDVVVIHGDGAVTGDSIAARTMYFIAYLAKQVFRTPVVMVNHTADLHHPNLREIAYHVYPLMDDVRFREPLSAERLRSVCRGAYAADAAFLFEPAPRSAWAPIAARATYLDVWPDVAAFDPSKPYLCIGGSSVLAHETDGARVLAGYRALIERIAAEYHGAIVLTVSDRMDQPYFRDLATELDLPVVGLRSPVQQVVDVLGNADLYIGGRWHPSIFALRGGTPIVPLSAKTSKMEALASMVGMATRLPDANDLRSAAGPLTRRILESLEGGDALRTRLRAWAQEQAEDSWNNVSYLERIARTPSATSG